MRKEAFPGFALRHNLDMWAATVLNKRWMHAQCELDMTDPPPPSSGISQPGKLRFKTWRRFSLAM